MPIVLPLPDRKHVAVCLIVDLPIDFYAHILYLIVLDELPFLTH